VSEITDYLQANKRGEKADPPTDIEAAIEEYLEDLLKDAK